MLGMSWDICLFKIVLPLSYWKRNYTRECSSQQFIKNKAENITLGEQIGLEEASWTSGIVLFSAYENFYLK